MEADIGYPDEPEPKRVRFPDSRYLGAFGDEGQLHVWHGWSDPDALVAEVVAAVTEQVGPEYAQDYLDFAQSPVIHKGWVRLIPARERFQTHPHPLDRWGGDGGVQLSEGRLRPFRVTLHFREGRLLLLNDERAAALDQQPHRALVSLFAGLPGVRWEKALWLYDH
jgi:hypothetical protein